jgi:hypothetical protein
MGLRDRKVHVSLSLHKNPIAETEKIAGSENYELI